jgi:hypothetical protein
MHAMYAHLIQLNLVKFDILMFQHAPGNLRSEKLRKWLDDII